MDSCKAALKMQTPKEEALEPNQAIPTAHGARIWRVKGAFPVDTAERSRSGTNSTLCTQHWESLSHDYVAAECCDNT